MGETVKSESAAERESGRGRRQRSQPVANGLNLFRRDPVGRCRQVKRVEPQEKLFLNRVDQPWNGAAPGQMSLSIRAILLPDPFAVGTAANP